MSFNIMIAVAQNWKVFAAILVCVALLILRLLGHRIWRKRLIVVAILPPLDAQVDRVYLDSRPTARIVVHNAAREALTCPRILLTFSTINAVAYVNAFGGPDFDAQLGCRRRRNGTTQLLIASSLELRAGRSWMFEVGVYSEKAVALTVEVFPSVEEDKVRTNASAVWSVARRITDPLHVVQKHNCASPKANDPGRVSIWPWAIAVALTSTVLAFLIASDAYAAIEQTSVSTWCTVEWPRLASSSVLVLMAVVLLGFYLKPNEPSVAVGYRNKKPLALPPDCEQSHEGTVAT